MLNVAILRQQRDATLGSQPAQRVLGLVQARRGVRVAPAEVCARVVRQGVHRGHRRVQAAGVFVDERRLLVHVHPFQTFKLGLGVRQLRRTGRGVQRGFDDVSRGWTRNVSEGRAVEPGYAGTRVGRSPGALSEKSGGGGVSEKSGEVGVPDSVRVSAGERGMRGVRRHSHHR